MPTLAEELDAIFKQTGGGVPLPAARQQPTSTNLQLPQLPRPRPPSPIIGTSETDVPLYNTPAPEWVPPEVSQRVEGLRGTASADPLDDLIAQLQDPAPLQPPGTVTEAPPVPEDLNLAIDDIMGILPPDESSWSILTNAFKRGVTKLHSSGRQWRMDMPDWLADPDEAARSFARQEQQYNRLGFSNREQSAAAEFLGAEGFWGKIKALQRNPILIGTTIAESLPLSVPSTVGGALASPGGLMGVAAGIGIGSGVTEYGTAVGQFLTDYKGIDISDEDQMVAAVNNPELMSEAREWAVKRGFSVGLFDGITALIAGPLAGAVTRRLGKLPDAGVVADAVPTRTSQVAGAASGLGVEAIGGASGEGVAQLATTGKLDMNDLILEAVGELGGGAPELFLSARASGRSGGAGERQTRVTDETLGDLGVEPEEILFSPEEAEAQGRTLFGFDIGKGATAVGTYEEAEREAGLQGTRKGRIFAITPEQVTGKVVNYEKVNKLTIDQISKFNLEADDQTNLMFHHALSAAGRGNSKASEDVDNFLSQYRVVSTGGLDIFSTSFQGPTKGLGVKFREINYGGLALRPDEEIERGKDIASSTKSHAGADDINLDKLSPGTLEPSFISLEYAVKNLGHDTIMELARQGGSTPEGITVLAEYLRDDSQRVGLLDKMSTKNLMFPADARLFIGGAIVANNDTAVAEVKAARVKRLDSGKKSFMNVAPSLSNWAYIFKREDGKAGEVVSYDPENLFNEISRDQQEAIAAAVGIMETLVKKWNLPFDIQVVPYNEDTVNEVGVKGLGNLGFYIPMDLFDPNAKKATIGIKVGQSVNGVQMYQVLMHEFGHFIEATGFMQMDPGVRTRILGAYRRFLLTSSVVDPLRAAGTPGRTMSTQDTNYMWSFEEWFAEQMARWAITSRRPLGFVAKYIRPLAKRLLEAMRTFQERDPFNQFRAEPEIENWLNSQLDGSRRGDWATQVTTWHNAETQARNESAQRREGDIGKMSPMTEQSAGMRDMAAKLGVEKIQAMAVQMGVTMPPIPSIFAQVDKFNWFYKWFLSLPQVAEKNVHIAELQVYRELVQMAQVEQANIMTAAHGRLTEWRKLGTRQAEAFGQMLFDITQMTYLTPPEVAAGVVRHPTTAELRRLVQQYGLSNQAMTLYGNVRNDFNQALSRYATLLINAAGKITDPVTQAQRILDIQTMVTNLRKKPYFPMIRYGKWTLTIRDRNAAAAQGSLVHFETFESKRQLQIAHRRARDQYPHGSGYDVTMGVLAEESRPFLGVPPQMIDLIASTLNLNPKQIADLELLRFQLAPEQSFKKRFLNRNEVSGWSEDAQRNYAHYFFHHAKHYMRVKYQERLTDQLKAVRQARGLRGDDQTKIGRIANFLADHMEEFLNPKGDLAALRSAGAVWYLGFVPQSALLNLTQLGIATAPFLSSKFGDLKTLPAMTKAAAALSSYYSKGKIRQHAGSNGIYRALSLAIEEGILDESQAAELAALSEGNIMLSSIPGTDVRKKWIKISSYAMMMFQAAEQFNRRVTFRTAWELAMENPATPWLNTLTQKHQLQLQRLLGLGIPPQEAIAFLAGKDAVQSTQFEYARYARPRFMQGRKGAFFMFYMFTQNMLFLLGNNPGTVLPRYLLTMMFLGGMMGLPGAEDLNDLVKAMAARFAGKDFDIEREARRYVVEVLGDPHYADLAMRGASRDALNLGFLHDIAGVTAFPQIDMSRQIGMGKVLPINPAFIIGTPGLSQEKAFRDAVVNNAGALFGIGYNLWKALTDGSTPWSDPKVWSSALPRSLKNFSRSAQVLATGQEVDRGDPPSTVQTFDRQDPVQVAEGIAIAMGLQPTRLTREWDSRIAKIEVDQYWTFRRGILLDQLANAYWKKDQDMMREARQAIMRFNESVPYKGKRISTQGARQSLEQRFGRATRQSRGQPARRNQVDIYRDMDQIYIRSLKKLETSSPSS